MISLKKYIESNQDAILAASLECYRAALAAMGSNGARVCPSVGDELNQDLLALRDRLSGSAPPSALTETEKEVERKLEDWASRAAGYYHTKAGEVKEIMLIMAQAAQAVGERDQRYKAQFGELTTRLQSIANLDDLGRVRRELNQSVAEIRTSMERMVEDGQQSVAQLRGELTAYEERLAVAERASTMDTLTGLRNRLGIERALAERVNGGGSFCFVMMDLDGFKAVNDQYGHLAGDELLKNFSEELRGQFRATDVLARWGGDEFAILLDCDSREAGERMERVRKWVFGDYPVKTGGAPRKVPVTAAVGVAVGRPGVTPEQLFEEADAAMYKDKAARRAGAKAGVK
jgi:diguanylate cyclase (GGDEF)-like protein